MTTDYTEIVTPLIVSKIMKFLGFKESTKGIGSVDKTHRQILIETTILMNKTEDGSGRFDKLSTSMFCSILNTGRLFPFVGKLVDINNPRVFSGEAVDHLKKTFDTWGLNGLGFKVEEARLNASMYTYWKRTPLSKTGSLNYIKENASKLHNSISQVETVVTREVKYWRESRVYDTFGVLLERSDGTIVISQDLRRVFLVLGITQSLGSGLPHMPSNLPFRYDSNRSQLASSLCKRLLYASATLTLLPWEGKIVFDGISICMYNNS